jgi:hypothetical protein
MKIIAFEAATKLGIPPLLDAEDMLMAKPKVVSVSEFQSLEFQFSEFQSFIVSEF